MVRGSPVADAGDRAIGPTALEDHDDGVNRRGRERCCEAQLPARWWISGKKRSCHDPGLAERLTTSNMKAAKPIALRGVIVYSTRGPDMMRWISSIGRLDFVPAAQRRAAEGLSLMMIRVASSSAAASAPKRRGLASRNGAWLPAIVKWGG